MAKRQRIQREGLVHLDPEKLQRRAIGLGLSKTALADQADISRNTVYQAFRGDGVYPNSALLIATALGVMVEELLPAPREEGSHEAEGEVVGEWRLAEYLGPWITASNGLQFRVCDMRHRFVENRRGRGKWYDLLGLSGKEREELRAHLVRHPTVCERIGNHPNIADNINTRPGSREDAWWVIDRWLPGQTLAEIIGNGSLPRTQLPSLMTDIAEGLAALHAANVVFRELAPSRIILSETDGRAVLTDFELAKLTDTGPTVSRDWPDDPYQAPEVSGGTSDERSDHYSWGRILLHAAAGELPAKGGELALLRHIGLPKPVWKVASACLSPAPSDRPRDVKTILRAISRWK